MIDADAAANIWKSNKQWLPLRTGQACWATSVIADFRRC
jgi:hypothetical protein